MTAYSTDGITWIQTTPPIKEKQYSIYYEDGKFVTVANNSSKAAYSTDGITWTAYNEDTGKNTLDKIFTISENWRIYLVVSTYVNQL